MFAGVGERTREGNDLYLEMKESGVLKDTALVFGQMDEPPGTRLRVALSALTMAEYFRDVQNQDVLLFIDNIFRFTQAGSEVSTLLGRMPSAVGYQPTLADEMGELQERITSTRGHSITSLQAIYVPADDITDPAPHTTFAHLDATTVLSRPISEMGIYPAVDPLDSTSRILDPQYVGEEHYDVASGSSRSFSATRSCRTSSRSWASTSCRRGQGPRRPGAPIQRFLSQNFFVAEQFTGDAGSFVPLAETIEAFKKLCEGDFDHLPGAGVLPLRWPRRRRGQRQEAVRVLSDGNPDQRRAGRARPCRVGGRADVVIARTTDGELSVMANHIPLLGVLRMTLPMSARCVRATATIKTSFWMPSGRPATSRRNVRRFLSVTKEKVSVFQSSKAPRDCASAA